ncbi:MAG: hypothetical protein F6K31_42685 [Symploca sp. SIO2G7]|nr:hypothetical protein [Symploca sp. SIO2G7]
MVMVQGSQTLDSATDWTSFRQPLGQLIRVWGLHLSSTIVDLGLPVKSLYTYLIPPIILALLLLALWHLLLVVSPKTMAFCLMGLMVPALGLILPDLINGGQLSVSTRYFISSLLMVTLIMAGWLRQLLLSERFVYRCWGQGILVVLLASGLVSGTLSAASFTWWNKDISYHNHAIGQVIRQANRPIVLVELGDMGLGNAISLSYEVPAETAFSFFKLGQVPEIPKGYSDYFIPYAKDELIDTIFAQTGKAAIPVEGISELWHLM